MAFIKNNFLLLFLYVLALSVALYFILNFARNDIHIYINNYVGNRFINAFFYYVTYLGDGRFAALIVLTILLLNVRTGIYATLSFLSATIVSTILKYFFFEDANRPHFVFKWVNRYPIRLVEGVDVHIHNSFPSGHATQAFGILFCIALVSKNQWVKLLCFFLALFTSFSRVYLSQHWLIDITAGSFIGVFFSIAFYFLIIRANRFQRLDKSLMDVRKA